MIMKMLWRIVCLFIACQSTLSTIQLSLINNAIFDPINTSYLMINLSNIESRDSCICQCYNRTNCFIITYYGYRQECELFSVPRQLGQLYVMPMTENTTVVIFKDRNYTGNSCNISTSSIFTYTTSPQGNYTNQIYNYTASFTGTAILEFGFKAKSLAKVWHLDDASITDSNASNVQMLVNGDFESGSLTGWQVACSSLNCGGTGGVLVQQNCHTGTYCYKGMCLGAYDFLRQSFNVVTGHVYMLSFWLYTDGNPQQAAYVDIHRE